MTSWVDMASASDHGDGRRPWPTDELIQRLWRGKAALHDRHARLSLPDKVRRVMELQRLALPLLAQRRELRSWEQPWEIEP